MAMNRNQQNAVYLQSGDPETEHRPSTSNQNGFTSPDPYIGQKGNLLTVADPSDDQKSKQYRLVQNDSAMDVLPSEGAVAWWKDRSAFLVTTDGDTVGRGNVAGVYRCTSAVDELVCIQRRGEGSVQFQSGTPSTVGLIVIPSATDAKADVLTAGAAATYPMLGVAISATDGGSPAQFTCALDVQDGMAEG